MGKNCRRLTDAEREIIRFCWDIISLPIKRRYDIKDKNFMVILTIMLFVISIINILFLVTTIVKNPILALGVTLAIMFFLFSTVNNDIIKPMKKQLVSLEKITSKHYNSCKEFIYNLKKDPPLCNEDLELIKFCEGILIDMEKINE